ncbi:dipeptide/oligopeptide/nickel ABC transporter ATP-binding protein [Synergistales bacterium]|nr:dipeptide/oligopeptide/nickel ABC transporter ATP-binding protein [Synergistales bacterium]
MTSGTTEPKELMLEVKNLTVEYQSDLETVHAVNGISFSLAKGGTIGLVGETGAGKTTTALALMRLLPERTGKIRQGDILLNGTSVLKSSDKELMLLRGETIAMIFQDPMTSLNPVLTIGDQISESILLHNSQGRTPEQIQGRVDEVLNMVGIPPARKREYPHQFSGGMRQRVVIAIAMACEPDLLIADEPTTALDVTIQAQVLMMIRKLRDRLGTSLVMITHDLGIVAQTCDNVAVMYAGQLVEVGSAKDIFNRENSHHPYTNGLFGSIPKLNERVKRLKPIPGLMPDPTALPEGCYFSPRCAESANMCLKARPEVYVKGEHKIKCHKMRNVDGYVKEEAEREEAERG